MEFDNPLFNSPENFFYKPHFCLDLLCQSPSLSNMISNAVAVGRIRTYFRPGFMIVIAVILLFSTYIFFDPTPLNLLRHENPSKKAVVCNLQSERYANNALVLGYTLEKYNANLFKKGVDLVLLMPYENDFTPTTLSRLKDVGWQFRWEDDIEVDYSDNLQANFRRNYQKLRVWAWTEYRKLALIDADCMCRGDISLLLSEKFGKSKFGSISADSDRFWCRTGYDQSGPTCRNFQCWYHVNYPLLGEV